MNTRVLWLLTAAILAAGCEKKPTSTTSAPAGPQTSPAPVLEPPPSVSQTPPPQPPTAKQPTRGSSFYSQRDLQVAMNDLKQIGLVINIMARAPRSAGDLKAEMRDMPAIYKKLESGEYVVARGARLASNSILVYEANTDTSGRRLVLMGDNSVKPMSSEDFDAAIKAQGGM